MQVSRNLIKQLMQKNMVIEIWSDILCPFCYIGKRKFEQALEQFKHNDEIEVIWKSFLLSPNLVTDTTKSIYQQLADHKGISIDDAKRMYANVKQLAEEVDLFYNIESMVVANSYKAHRLLHLAKKHGKQNDLEELLFAANFTEGKNIDDNKTLLALGIKLDLDVAEITNLLESDQYSEEVDKDIYEAKQVGLRSVPYFAFNDKYSVTGAQNIEVFSKTLDKAFEEWKSNKTIIKMDLPIAKSCGSKKMKQ